MSRTSTGYAALHDYLCRRNLGHHSVAFSHAGVSLANLDMIGSSDFPVDVAAHPMYISAPDERQRVYDCVAHFAANKEAELAAAKRPNNSSGVSRGRGGSQSRVITTPSKTLLLPTANEHARQATIFLEHHNVSRLWPRAKSVVTSNLGLSTAGRSRSATEATAVDSPVDGSAPGLGTGDVYGAAARRCPVCTSIKGGVAGGCGHHGSHGGGAGAGGDPGKWGGHWQYQVAQVVPLGGGESTVIPAWTPFRPHESDAIEMARRRGRRRVPVRGSDLNFEKLLWNGMPVRFVEGAYEPGVAFPTLPAGAMVAIPPGATDADGADGSGGDGTSKANAGGGRANSMRDARDRLARSHLGEEEGIARRLIEAAEAAARADLRRFNDAARAAAHAARRHDLERLEHEARLAIEAEEAAMEPRLRRAFEQGLEDALRREADRRQEILRAQQRAQLEEVEAAARAALEQQEAAYRANLTRLFHMLNDRVKAALARKRRREDEAAAAALKATSGHDNGTGSTGTRCPHCYRADCDFFCDPWRASWKAFGVEAVREADWRTVARRAERADRRRLAVSESAAGAAAPPLDGSAIAQRTRQRLRELAESSRRRSEGHSLADLVQLARNADAECLVRAEGADAVDYDARGAWAPSSHVQTPRQQSLPGAEHTGATPPSAQRPGTAAPPRQSIDRPSSRPSSAGGAVHRRPSAAPSASPQSRHDPSPRLVQAARRAARRVARLSTGPRPTSAPSAAASIAAPTVATPSDVAAPIAAPVAAPKSSATAPSSRRPASAGPSRPQRQPCAQPFTSRPSEASVGSLGSAAPPLSESDGGAQRSNIGTSASARLSAATTASRRQQLGVRPEMHAFLARRSARVGGGFGRPSSASQPRSESALPSGRPVTGAPVHRSTLGSTTGGASRAASPPSSLEIYNRLRSLRLEQGFRRFNDNLRAAAAGMVLKPPVESRNAGGSASAPTAFTPTEGSRHDP